MDVVQEIKNRLSIADVVGKYVALKPAGRNLKGLCPFHQDHNPSFVVSNDKGLAWCFACQNGGDIFSVTQKLERVDFPEALKILADRAGVSLSGTSPEKTALRKEKKLRLMEVLEASNRFFRKNLETARGVSEKIAARKLEPQILQQFELGYAPDDFHALEKYLLKEGFAHGEMLEAGVVSTKDAQGKEVYDRFRGRIIFPIRDANGQLKGFGGRIFGDGEPKYLNSPETILYQKSQILYGLNFAREAIRSQGFCLVTEGYFDTIACHNAGITNTVASSGTALTVEQIKLLQRFTNDLVFAFDADNAGQEATKRAIAAALVSGANSFVLIIPDGKDPDEALRQDRTAFLEALTRRQPVLDYLLQRALQSKDPQDVAVQREVLDEILPFIALLPGALEREHYLKKLAEKLRISLSTVQKEFSLQQKSPLTSLEPPAAERAQSPEKIIGFRYLIGAIFAFPELFPWIRESFVIDLAPAGLEKRIYNALTAEYNPAAVLSPEKIADSFAPEEIESWKIWTLCAEEDIQHLPLPSKKDILRTTVRDLNKQFITKEKDRLNLLLKKAPKGSSEQQEITKKLMDFTRLLQHISSS